jgi:hypothetical protein
VLVVLSAGMAAAVFGENYAALAVGAANGAFWWRGERRVSIGAPG